MNNESLLRPSKHHPSPTDCVQDAFIATLNALPYEETEEGDWFDQRVKAVKEWLLG